MQIEKFDAFMETMNASYMPMSSGNTGQDHTADFSKTFEQTAFSDSVDLTQSKGYSIQNNDSFSLNQKEQVSEPDNSPAKETDDRFNSENNDKNPKPVKADDNRQKSDQTSEKQDQGDQKELKDKSGETEAQKNTSNDKNAKNKGKEDAAQAVKDELKKFQAKHSELIEVKEDVKGNIGETRGANAGNTAEKVLLKNIGNEKDSGQTSNGEQPQESQGEKSEQLEAKFVKDLEVEGKETQTPKREANVQKNQHKQDNTFLNILNDSGKDLRQVDEIKVQKAATHQQLMQQYEGLKERISDNVETSIKFLMANGESKVTMQLQPPELGKVEVELFMKDKQVSAKINTENVAVKEVILSNLDQLKSNLENAGHHIDKFEVEVGGFKNHFDQHLDGDGKGSGKGGSGKGENGSPQDPNEPVPGKIINHRATTFFLGRSINVVI
jgi:flagellar hook-length control protein FliK